MIDWIKIIIVFTGGLALFLYGMELMSDGLVKASGTKIRRILNIFTKNRFAAFITGAVSTTIIQSSSAVSVMVISLVESNLIKYKQTFGILLGAGIGTTITAQIIAFKITDYSLVIVALGFFLRILSKREILKFTGSALLGFGLLFYGLQIMSEAMIPLRTQDQIIGVLLQLENPLLGILAGLIFTAIIQSSSAFIGILIVLASQGLLTLDAAIPLLLGSNIGTTATAILASIKAGYEAKRVAFTFFLIKLTGVLIIFWWIPSYIDLVKKITSLFLESNLDNSSLLTRQIANAHTLFNVGASMLLLPFSELISKGIMKLMPAKKQPKEKRVELKFIQNKMIDQPALALVLAKKETLEMAAEVKRMLEEIIHPFTENKEGNIYKIEDYEKNVDFYQFKITAYVTKISQKNIAEELIDESFKIMYIVSELEEIADIIYNSLFDKALLWMNSQKHFSDEGKKELVSFHQHILNHFDKALTVFNSYDAKSISKLKLENKLLRNLSIELKQKHFMRLSQNIPESISTSENHMEIVGNLRSIHSHISNVIRILYQESQRHSRN
jgi:phosphate:Na+ symporter